MPTWAPSPSGCAAATGRHGRWSGRRGMMGLVACARLFVLWMVAVTVVPYVVAVLAPDLVRGRRCTGCSPDGLRMAIGGAGDLRRAWPSAAWKHLPDRRRSRRCCCVQAPVDLGDLRPPGPDATRCATCSSASCCDPVLRLGDGQLDMIHIDRSRRRGLEQGGAGPALMARGNWVIMFPEGTRIPRRAAGTRPGTAGHRHRAAGGADRRHLGHAAGRAGASARRRDRHLDRPPHQRRAPADELMREVRKPGSRPRCAASTAGLPVSGSSQAPAVGIVKHPGLCS